jgi:hypothetical protein
MCLAILTLLFGGMFLYVKQKISMMESKLHLLSETISTMAGITMQQHPFECREVGHESLCNSESSSESYSESDESTSDTDSEIEIELCEPELKSIELSEPKKLEPEVKTIDLEVEHVRDEMITEPVKIRVSDDDVTSTKQIVVDMSYESMTVKELKEKIAELNGPKFKTKKEMLEFLKK